MTKIIFGAVLCVAMFGSLASALSQCREPNGTYAVSGSCDAYIECKNGVAEERLCPDGLLFNGHSSGYPCGYPIDVQCDQPQARLQPAQPTDDCPHQFGYYRMGDATHCGQFKNCASGRGFIFDCPEGLAWNKETYKCDWPDQVADCDAEKFLGFKCPAPAPKSNLLGDQELEYEFYPSNENCQVYFICIEGRPRRISCGEDQAFNPETNMCDEIENVSTCSGDVRQKGQEIKNARLAASKSQPVVRNQIYGQQTRTQAFGQQQNKQQQGTQYRSVTAAELCAEKNGRIAHAAQCDAYTECLDGVPVEKLCPDGLVFHQRTRHTGECTYAPFSTCKERTRLQPANGTAECPRQFGFYPSGDSKNCGIYKNCAHGEATITKCPEGLAFNVETYQCDWPDLVNDCNSEAYLGFTCPSTNVVVADARQAAVDVGAEGELLYFRHPDSCKKYFVCVNGHPRLYSCGKYLAFNIETKLCDFYTHVPECYNRLRTARNEKS